jgi:ATP-dependent Clp protease ATP-binding subunit ClpA
MITFAELKNKSLKLFPALFLEKYSTFKGRKLTRTIFLWFLGVAFLLMIIHPIIPLEYVNLATFFVDYEKNFRSAFFFLFSIWLSMYLAEAFYFSFYFRQAEVDFEIAKLAINSDASDITKSFLDSQIGQYTMMRLGVGPDQINNFLTHRERQIRETSFDIELIKNKNYISVFDYGHSLYKNDKEFAFFLEQYGISEEDFIGGMEWADDIEWKIREFEKWWDKTNLVRKKSIGRKWSFNRIDSIEKYGHSIFTDKNYLNLADHWRVFKKDAQRIESALVKGGHRNVLVVSPTVDAGMQVISALAKMILLGRVLFELEGRRIFVIDFEKVLSGVQKGDDFKKNIDEIFSNVKSSDNTILVAPKLEMALDKANELDFDLLSEIDYLLKENNVQLISVVNNQDYYSLVQTNQKVNTLFEKVLISEADNKSIIRILQNIVYPYEQKQDVLFTYQSIKEITDKTKIYFDDVVYPEKVTNILEKVINQAKLQDKKIIKKEDVSSVITVKYEN